MTTALDSSCFEFWIWTNHNSLLSIVTNQFASFWIDIRSPQCYFRVCQSGEIWNKKAFFPYIFIFYYIKQIDYMLYMLPCVCSVLYNNPSYSRILIGSRLWSIRGQTHRWRQRSIQVFLNFLNFEFEPITILF